MKQFNHASSNQCSPVQICKIRVVFKLFTVLAKFHCNLIKKETAPVESNSRLSPIMIIPNLYLALDIYEFPTSR